MKHCVQIIGGQFRGKKIHVPDVAGLRPTPSRVRETLFNWLMHRIRGARCLDAFAGSGALGLEAYSRGAAHVTLVEQEKIAALHLKKLLSSFGSSHLQLVPEDACHFLEETKESYDIIFLDPPFQTNLLPQCLGIIAQREEILPAGGVVYIESPQEMVLDPSIFKLVKIKRAGQVVYGLYEKNFRESPSQP